MNEYEERASSPGKGEASFQEGRLHSQHWTSRSLPVLRLEKPDLATDPINVDLLIAESNLHPILQVLSKEFVSNAEVTPQRDIQGAFQDAARAVEEVEANPGLDEDSLTAEGWEGVRARFIETVLEIVRDHLCVFSEVLQTRSNAHLGETDQNLTAVSDLSDPTLEHSKALLRNKIHLMETLSKKIHASDQKLKFLKETSQEREASTTATISQIQNRNARLEGMNSYLYARVVSNDVSQRSRDGILPSSGNSELVSSLRRKLDVVERRLLQSESLLMQAHDFDGGSSTFLATGPLETLAPEEQLLKTAQRRLDDKILGIESLPSRKENMTQVEKEVFEQKVLSQERKRVQKRKELVVAAHNSILTRLSHATQERFERLSIALRTLQTQEADVANRQDDLRKEAAKSLLLQRTDDLQHIREALQAQICGERDSLLVTVKETLTSCEAQETLALHRAITSREPVFEAGEVATDSPANAAVSTGKDSGSQQRLRLPSSQKVKSLGDNNAERARRRMEYPEPHDSKRDLKEKDGIKKLVTAQLVSVCTQTEFAKATTKNTEPGVMKPFERRKCESGNRNDEAVSNETVIQESENSDQLLSKELVSKNTKMTDEQIIEEDAASNSSPEAPRELPIEAKTLSFQKEISESFQTALESAVEDQQGPQIKLLQTLVNNAEPNTVPTPKKEFTARSKLAVLKVVSPSPSQSRTSTPLLNRALGPLGPTKAPSVEGNNVAVAPTVGGLSAACFSCGHPLRCARCEAPTGPVVSRNGLARAVEAGIVAGEAKEALAHDHRRAEFKIAAANASLRRLQAPDSRKDEIGGSFRFDSALDPMFERAAKMKAFWQLKRDRLIAESKAVADELHVRLVFALYRQSHLLKVQHPSLKQILHEAKKKVETQQAVLKEKGQHGISQESSPCDFPAGITGRAVPFLARNHQVLEEEASDPSPSQSHSAQREVTLSIPLGDHFAPPTLSTTGATPVRTVRGESSTKLKFPLSNTLKYTSTHQPEMKPAVVTSLSRIRATQTPPGDYGERATSSHDTHSKTSNPSDHSCTMRELHSRFKRNDKEYFDEYQTGEKLADTVEPSLSKVPAGFDLNSPSKQLGIRDTQSHVLQGDSLHSSPICFQEREERHLADERFPDLPTSSNNVSRLTGRLLSRNRQRGPLVSGLVNPGEHRSHLSLGKRFTAKIGGKPIDPGSNQRYVKQTKH